MRTLLVLALAGALRASDPSPLEIHKARAALLLTRLEFGPALLEAQAANRVAPDDVGAYQLMAAAQIELGDYAEAEKQLQWMLDLRIGKADSQGWMLVARFREATGDLDGALEAANLAFSRVPPGSDTERAHAAAYASRLLCRLGKPDLAERTIEPFASAADASAAVLEAAARARMAQGRKDEAGRILRRLVESSPHPRYFYLRAQSTALPADYRVFEQAALRVAGEPDNANRELALYYAGRGKQSAKAVEIARHESLRRHDVLTLDALAAALFADRQTAEARDVMRRVLAVGTVDPEILAHAARMGVRKP